MPHRNRNSWGVRSPAYPHFRRQCWSDPHENFTRDVSSDNEITVKFWRSSGSVSRSRNFLKEFFLPLLDWGSSTNSTDNSRNCRRILLEFFWACDISQAKKTFNFDADPDRDSDPWIFNETVTTPGQGNFTNTSRTWRRFVLSECSSFCCFSICHIAVTTYR